jgi:hypothetical protein
MSKLQIVLSDQCYTSFDQPWIVDITNEYFDIVYVEHDPAIDAKAIFVTNIFDNTKWYRQHHKLIIDNLWEMYKQDNRGFVLANKNWFWYNESLWYTHLGYQNHIPNPRIVKNGLLLMNLKKLHRDWLFKKLSLNELLYSYVQAGHRIDGDMDINDGEWQRYFNPNWYDSTAFSIVAETTVYHDDIIFVTEKTFKPIAFQHPFIIFGQMGILAYIRSLGFETFENMFDESYDTEPDIETRLDNLSAQINNYFHNDYDRITIEKMKHNKELFFDKQLVKTRIIKEIIEPILEYAET